MFTRCIVCHAPFPANTTLEHFPVGRRVAFDPRRGRLWAVCGACKRWSLAPIEERWEALEEIERTVRDRARLLSRTENIALLRAGEMDIVQVGEARRAEEAWWRYGRELLDRRRRARRIATVGTVATGALVVGGLAAGVSVLGLWWGAHKLPDGLRSMARWLHFGSTAWRGTSRCVSCGAPIHQIRFADRDKLILAPGNDGEISVRYRCERCRRPTAHRFNGVEAEHLLRRSLAYQHFSGASERRVIAATRLIDEAGSALGLKQTLAGQWNGLRALPRTRAIALEIATSEDSERRLLELELAELEARWREEEELASIVDGELTPVPLLEGIRQRLAGTARRTREVGAS